MATFTSNIPMVINNSTIMKDVSAQTIDISQNLFVSGSSTFLESVDLCGQVTIDNNLDVYGSVFIENNLDVSGNVVIYGTLDISAFAFRNLGISEDVVIDGTLDISGDVTIKGNLNLQNSTYTYDKTTINSIHLDICDNIIKINVKENQDLPSGIMIQDVCTNVFCGFSGRKETQEHSDKFIITKTNYDETSDTSITYDKSVDVFINGSLDVSGTINGVGFGNYRIIPIGGIILWTSFSVPSGWALCDGTNGTPNLKGKFVIGMDASIDEFDAIDNSGGSLIISSDNLPTHSHSGTTDISGSHSHSGTTDDDGSHKHVFQNLAYTSVKATSGTQIPGTGSLTTSVADDHSHTFTTDISGEHAHTFTTDTCGNSLPYYPPYYVLTYIMRIF